MVTLRETSTDGDRIGKPFRFPALPYPGLLIGYGPGIYEVVRVHVEVLIRNRWPSGMVSR
jgi:hypothetical protein